MISYATTVPNAHQWYRRVSCISNRLAASKRQCASCVTNHRSYHGTSNNNTNTKNHVAHVRSALSDGPLPYERGWAWQHVLLNRRLSYMRTQQQQLAQQQDGTAADTADNTKGDTMKSMHDNDWLLLFEHDPVYTLGRGASEDHLTFLNKESDGGEEKRRRLGRKYRGEDASRLNIDQSTRHISQTMSVEEEVDHLSTQSTRASTPVHAPNGSPIYRIERGGEVTYHGPGQLVMYPLLNLKHPAYQQDLHWYLRQIEEVIIQTLSEFDIQSNRDDINTGVWVGQNKIAAVGVSSARWITTHGLAINVHPNLDHFDKDIITPCGIEERGVTSIADVLGPESPTVQEVAEVALKSFGDVFEIDLGSVDSIK